MNFRERIENAISPLIDRLREELALVPTLSILAHYRLRSASAFDRSKVPDGFMFKWRYLWALLLANPFVETRSKMPQVGAIDKLIEDIFETYVIGAIYERGAVPGSEQEFLTRLGLALRVREFDSLLGFPEQINNWADVRLTPFDNTYFIPTVGLKFQKVSAWVSGLVETLKVRLNAYLDQFAPIFKKIQEDEADGKINRDVQPC